ncbi:MAG: GNAT family N-acetyltransferase [Chloroflexi bacterium]|nr:GNAT family N-acetyltransferase [Chloroflexota bacterium]
MTSTDVAVTVRPMSLEDLDAILSIDRRIRSAGKAITYANLTTERILTIDKKLTELRRATSYAELITGDASGLLEFGFVAESEGRVRGFILGRTADVGQPPTRAGLILILGVHPDYERRGIGRRLVNAICEKFRSEGIKTVRIGIDQRDKQLIGFFERMGFSVRHLIDYAKTL